MLRDGIIRQVRRFDQGISYRSGDIGTKLFDAQNLILVQGKLQTRPGALRFNGDTLASRVLSLSYYANNTGTKQVIAKASTTLKAANVSDHIFNNIKTGLTSTTKHDAVTMNGRHIIAIENDGLFSWDGTTFATLGVDAPSAPSVAAAAGGSLTDKTYQVAITFECSSTGFETNQGAASASQATSSGGGNSTIAVSAIPVSTHPLVDFKNVYIKNVTDSGNFLYVGQIANSTTTYNITANPAANSATPPTGKDTPISGGAKYLTVYNGQVLASGNSNHPSDVYFSNSAEPDGWSTLNTLVVAQGSGAVTGLAAGLFNDQQINQYLVVFKKRSITIFTTDLNNNDNQTTIEGIGCESHKSIITKDGNIYFMSNYGWKRIVNARIDKNTLANGDIDDIFRQSGWAYGLNKQQTQNAFGVNYSELNTYMCWAAEGASTSFDKCYNYNFEKDSFMPSTLGGSTCATVGDDANGEETVYIGKNDGFVYTYNIRNDRHDDSTSGGFDLDTDQLDVDTLEISTALSIPTFVYFAWAPEDGPFDTSYNVRDLILDAISNTSDTLSTVTVKAFLNFSRTISYDYTVDFYTTEGFRLDVSRLDVDILADDRTRSRILTDINRSCKNMLIGIFQDTQDAFLQLLSYQLNYSKNGNANT